MNQILHLFLELQVDVDGIYRLLLFLKRMYWFRRWLQYTIKISCCELCTQFGVPVCYSCRKDDCFVAFRR